MKPYFSDLTPEQQATYGNGCGVRWLPVPSFSFSASCRHHDFNWERGCGANHWYENLWQAPYYYTRGNWHFFILNIKDSVYLHHYFWAVMYFIGVMLFSWPWFSIGPWRTIEEILERDRRAKM